MPDAFAANRLSCVRLGRRFAPARATMQGLLAGLLFLAVPLLGCAQQPDSSGAPADTTGGIWTDGILDGSEILPSGRFDSDVPYVPTPENVVDSMLVLAGVGTDDVVYDLGSGDGRIPIFAARTYGARGVGIEIKPDLVEEARANAREAGVADRVTFRQGDLFEADLSGATVVTLYLLPDVNRQLRPRLFEQLDPGDRVVSHDFDMDEWEPDTTIRVSQSTLYLWTIPEEPPSFVDE
jgi:SAM-dependent methyltransferase